MIANAAVEEGLGYDLLLMSGGVSAGKYDIVERMLSGLGAEFFFDRVLIQPGQPLVFGRARGTFNDPNVLGAFLVLPALIAFQRVLTGRLSSAFNAAVGEYPPSPPRPPPSSWP